MRKAIRWGGLLAVAGVGFVLASCSENGPTAIQEANQPTVTEAPAVTETPLFATYAGSGLCMGNDAVTHHENVDGFNANTSPLAFNCTSGDIKIANARTASNTPIPCTPGDVVPVNLVADIVETATSERVDVGIWVEDGNNGAGGAEDGVCKFFYFDEADIDGPGDYPIDYDGDDCGDMSDAGTVEDFALGGLNITCPAVPDTIINGVPQIRIDACVSWTQPGGDRVCSDSNPRAGTLPANKSKCNCDGFFVPVEIVTKLTLVKTVTNDNGGGALATAWTLSAAGPTPISGATGAAAVTGAIVDPGAYTLSESGPSGYLAGAWSCVGGTQVGNVVTLALGDDVTCTINNNDIAPQLKLVKTVTNDNGGTAAPNDWDLTATGSGGFTELTPAAADATFRNVTAGVAYALSETGPGGYTAGAWSCVGGSQVGSSITLALNTQVTCTINNNDIAPQLKLVKTVTNNDGGTAVANDWDLTATGSGGFTELTPAAADATFRNVTAGVSYALSETGPGGYTAGAWSCNGGTQVGSSITLALNQQVTCTINNDDDAVLYPGNSVNVRLLDIDLDFGTALSGSFDVQNVSSNIASITVVNVTAQFKPSGGGGWSPVGVSGCTFDPSLPDDIAVGGTNSYDFDCTLDSAVSGGTLKVTVQVLLYGAPNKFNFTSTLTLNI
jgi:hypothetical protein